MVTTINMQAIRKVETRNNNYCSCLRNENGIMSFKDGVGTDAAMCKQEDGMRKKSMRMIAFASIVPTLINAAVAYGNLNETQTANTEEERFY